MRRDSMMPSAAERPYLLIFLGGLGIFGTVALIVAVMVASLIVPDHDWISETISDLAAGPLEIVTDVALYGFSVALVATAMAASHSHLGRVFWSIGTVSLGALAAVVAVIAGHNEYGDGDHVGITIHVELVYALGVLFLVAMFSMAKGAGRHHPNLSVAFVVLGVAWGILAPIFFVVPDNVDGLYERGVGLVASAFVITLSWMFLRRGIASR